jgi:hypothetical protein
MALSERAGSPASPGSLRFFASPNALDTSAFKPYLIIVAVNLDPEPECVEHRPPYVRVGGDQ